MGILQDLTYGAAKRWIAGKDMETALAKAKEANAKGLGAILNYLGEDVKDPSVAESHFKEYVKLQRAIGGARIDGCVSVKLTQFGLGVLEDSAVLEKAAQLVEEAEGMGRMLWLDMEGSAVTTRTLQIHSKLLEAHKNVGVALQAYLRRSEEDLKNLMDVGGKVRLVKGAYREPSDLVFRSRQQVTENYLKLMRTLFEKGQGFAVATHDSRPIREAQKLHESSPNTKFEFEMLRGIRDDLKLELARAGYRVVDYMPYGEEWYPYSVRRIKEHPSNVWLLLRSI
ncbi:MAG TPA: proline dehydrogenase family protein [Nitrososphaerales archaeon]|nr:proline dehydrogenase family protein [Nitrososphaerales archaeon]